MRRWGVTGAAALFCMSGYASAQEFGDVLLPGQQAVYSHRPVPPPYNTGYDLVYYCRVPALSFTAVTLAKLSNGPSKNDIELASSVSPTSSDGFVSSRILAQDVGNGDLPKVLVLPPETYETTRIIVIHGRDNNPASYRLYCDNSNVFEQLATAALKTFVIALIRDNFGGSSLVDNDNANRAASLVFSLVQRNNILAIGIDALREELNIKLKKEFPDNLNTVTFLTSITIDSLQDIYKHAFYEMSLKTR